MEIVARGKRYIKEPFFSLRNHYWLVSDIKWPWGHLIFNRLFGLYTGLKETKWK